MREHTYTIAILVFLLVICIILSITIPIAVRNGWMGNLNNYMEHGNHATEEEEEETTDGGEDTQSETNVH